ncbi:MAG: SpoIVB peptidase [Bacilli bacterium]|nr:SpoIVB peptidase [Bacilli bacterium]
MKKIKELIIYILLLVTILPSNAFAYSDKLIVSGKNIGIEINTNGVMVVGLYSINNISPAKEADIRLGDNIIKVNDIKVTNIKEMLTVIDKYKNNNVVKITYVRGNKEYNTNLKLIKDDNNIYKTGLYVKDTISGIGTLTYIDPESGMYGALGHEIIDKNTLSIVNISGGKIYKSNVIGINKSKKGNAGEKNAIFYKDEVYGSIDKNTSSGIFGKYYVDKDSSILYDVANIDEIKLGKAKILTVLKNNEIKEYDIKINRLSSSNLSTKNISFSITDKELLENAGGIVQGMSGSPIIQDNKIIGAVTHVVIENPINGYGIYITNMLNEMEK